MPLFIKEFLSRNMYLFWNFLLESAIYKGTPYSKLIFILTRSFFYKGIPYWKPLSIKEFLIGRLYL